jgi:hypothetical protein
MLDPSTGEVLERRLEHETGEARRFYASLFAPARMGIEATDERPLRRAPLTPLPARKAQSVS